MYLCIHLSGTIQFNAFASLTSKTFFDSNVFLLQPEEVHCMLRYKLS